MSLIVDVSWLHRRVFEMMAKYLTMEDLRKDAKGTRSVSRSEESITVSQVGVVHSSINIFDEPTFR